MEQQSGADGSTFSSATLQERIRRIAAIRQKTPEDVLNEALNQYEAAPDVLALTPEDIQRIPRETKKLIVSEWFREVGVRNSAEMTPAQKKHRARVAALSRYAQTRWKDPKEMHREFATIRRQAGSERYEAALKDLRINPEDFQEVSWEALAAVKDLRDRLRLPPK